MYEKVNPSHPDKVADRIAGAIVDLGYHKAESPKVACEVLIGHGLCTIVIESSVEFDSGEIGAIVERIGGDNLALNIKVVSQDLNLAMNQYRGIRVGDNGIFKGVPIGIEEGRLSHIARVLYREYPYDGKYIYDKESDTLIICQSNAPKKGVETFLRKACPSIKNILVNPIGDWSGGTEVDTGATNRKLGSDMGSSITGGGLHGKDLSKADVAVNIYLYKRAQEEGRVLSGYGSIGADSVMINGELVSYLDIVSYARDYIERIGGFEKFAEWGLI